MNKNTFASVLIVSLFGLGLAGCSTTSSVVPLGDGTYVATQEAGNGFATSQEAMAKLKAAALKNASEFCATQGKQMKVVSVVEDRPRFKTASLAKVKVVFKSLSSSDPEFTAAETEAAPAPAPVVEPPPAPAPTKAQKDSLLFTPSKVTVTTATPAPAPVAAPAPAAAPAKSRMLSTDELVDELTKLDDLRKKGILSDDEFQAEKKKVLKRSR